MCRNHGVTITDSHMTQFKETEDVTKVPRSHCVKIQNRDSRKERIYTGTGYVRPLALSDYLGSCFCFLCDIRQKIKDFLIVLN